MIPKPGGMYVYIREAFGALPAFLYAWVGVLGHPRRRRRRRRGRIRRVFLRVLPRSRTSNVLFTSAGLGLGGTAGRGRGRSPPLGDALRRHQGGRSDPGPLHVSDRPRALVARASAVLWSPAPASAPRRPRPPPITTAGVRHRHGGRLLVLLRLERDRGGRRRGRQPPERNLPLALIRRTGLVTLLYVGVNVAFLKAIPSAELAPVAHPAALAATRLFGPGAAVAIALAVTAAAAGLSLRRDRSRAPHRLRARQGRPVLPRAFARVHPASTRRPSRSSCRRSGCRSCVSRAATTSSTRMRRSP